MLDRLAHRGPDDEGLYNDAFCALGQRRLAIVDLVTGHQPIANEDNTVWVTFNGEIYNFPELRAELRSAGHRFSSQTDTEVIVHGYEEYGLGILPRLNGMFAFALWDLPRRRLVLARDPFGIKPLYVRADSHHVVFSSEMRALRADPSFHPEVDPRGLDAYLSFQFVPSPRTILRDVQKLRPGHCLIFENGRMREWAFDREAAPLQLAANEATLLSELRSLLKNAVERQLMSDVPLGALLSGGVDSAAVVSLMQQLNGGKVKTFTVGFEGVFDKNELDSARETARLLGTEHFETVLSVSDCVADIEAAIWALDEPVATTSALAMFRLSQLAASQVKVVLTGQGVDEPWAGYRRFRGEKFGRLFRMLPHQFRDRVVDRVLRRLPRAEVLHRAARALGEGVPSRRFSGVYSLLAPELKSALYRGELHEYARTDPRPVELEYWLEPVEQRSTLSQQLYLETRFSLSDNFLMYGDKMSMAASLEARVPFLDLELMRFVEGLPDNLRLRGWRGHKYLFRKAIAAWVPQEILARPKVGFATPMDQWFQGPLSGYLRDRLVSRGGPCSQYFDSEAIDGMISAHVSRKHDHSRALYALLIFAVWHDRFFA